jgi:peptidoglycan/LPS O-acetylase OafA/YrhL
MGAFLFIFDLEIKHHQSSSSMNKELQSDRVQELDALRGIAALSVVFFHFTMGMPQAQYGFKCGTTGVELFFMISGFVILMSLNKVKNSKEFIVNRISRLYPTYWACVTFTFLLILITKMGMLNGGDIVKYIANLTMFQFYFRIKNIDGPYWTMIVEMLFYMGMVLLFQFRFMKYLNQIGIGLLILLGLTALLNSQFLLIEKIMWWLPILEYLPLFLAGTVFYKIYLNKYHFFKNYSIIILCLLCQILLFKYGRSKTFINNTEYAIMLALYFSLFTLFVFGKLNFLICNVTLFLGKISYALYLVHQYISIGCIIPFFMGKLHFNFWISSFLIALPIVIILATLITYYIEIPLSKRLKSKMKEVL